MDKKVILVDLDGVLADYDGLLGQEFIKKYPDIPWDSRRKEFELSPEMDKLAKAIVTQPGFFASLAPIAGCIECIKRMDQNGHDVKFCTAPLAEYKYCIPEKYAWIEQHFGKDWTRKVIMTKDKTLIVGDYLIDDKPEPKGQYTPQWIHIVYNQSYNEHVKDKPRLSNWDVNSVEFNQFFGPVISK